MFCTEILRIGASKNRTGHVYFLLWQNTTVTAHVTSPLFRGTLDRKAVATGMCKQNVMIRSCDIGFLKIHNIDL